MGFSASSGKWRPLKLWLLSFFLLSNNYMRLIAGQNDTNAIRERERCLLTCHDGMKYSSLTSLMVSLQLKYRILWYGYCWGPPQTFILICCIIYPETLHVSIFCKVLGITQAFINLLFEAWLPKTVQDHQYLNGLQSSWHICSQNH